MDGLELDGSQHGGQAHRESADTCGMCSPDSPSTAGERLEPTYVPVSARMQSSVTPIQCAAGTALETEAEEQHVRFSGLGVTPGTLELVKLQRPELINKPSLPLPSALSEPCPILQEYSRPWRALRLGAQSEPEQSDGLPQGTDGFIATGDWVEF